MVEFLLRSAGELVARAGDWLSLRFLVQPSVAALLAIRAGVRDAQAGRPPFVWTLIHWPSARRLLLREAWHDVAKLFTAAAALDVVYQYTVLHWIHPLQAVIVAVSLAVVPYAVLRGPCSRLTALLRRRRARRRSPGHAGELLSRTSRARR